MNLLNANPIKWSNTLKEFVGKLQNFIDLLETLQSRHFKAVENRSVQGHLTIFYSKPKFFKT